MIKKITLCFLSLVIVFGLFSCGEKSASDEYVYLPQTKIEYRRSPSALQRDYKYTYKYDSNGNVVKEQLYTKSPRAWFYFLREHCFDTTYTYDAEGRITQELITEEHFSTALTDSHSIYEHGFDYFYDENGKLSRKDYVQLPGHSYAFNGFKYMYDENGNLAKVTQYSVDGPDGMGKWYKYDSDNVLIEEGSRKYLEHSYDDYGNLTYRAFREAGQYGDYTYTYDKKNRLIKEVYVRYSPEGEKTEEITVEYSNFKKMALNK